jgi:hypothetical protein
MMNVDKKHISSLIKDLEVDKKLQVKLESTQDEIDTNECKEHHKHKIKQKLYDASNMIKKHKKQASSIILIFDKRNFLSEIFYNCTRSCQLTQI